MPPSKTDEWKRIPLVPYESYHEYQTLLQSTVRKYADMVERVLITVKNSNRPYINTTLKPWSLSHYGFLRNITILWMNEGRDVLLEFTKGLGKEWCDAVSVNFAVRLNTAVRVFVMNNPIFEHARSTDASFDDYQEDILDFLRKETAHYINEYGLNPYDRGYTFNTINFVYYGPTYSIATDPSLTYRTMDENCGMLPVGKLQEIMLAFAIGTHIRTTKADKERSPVAMLTDDHLRIIFRYDIFLGN